LSPDKAVTLVVSVGEGHQWINLYCIADLLAFASGEAEIRRLGWVDPYPYAWETVRWSGNGGVLFSAAGDYSGFDRELHRPASGPEMNDSSKEWEWLIAAGTFRPGNGK
jgi:hypothetical protein